MFSKLRSTVPLIIAFLFSSSAHGEVVNASFNEDANEIILDVTYGGGCGEHDWDLVVSPMCLETMPPKCSATLIHTTSDPCEGLLSDRLAFKNITHPARGEYSLSIRLGDSTKTILINNTGIVDQLNSCTFDGKTYEIGEGRPDSDGCNSCSCRENGVWACTELFCRPPQPNRNDYCQDPENGSRVVIGSTIPAGDGCNTCTCRSLGNHVGFMCSEVFCQNPEPRATCQFQGQSLRIGDRVPAGDGCNTCTCREGGFMACTELACRR